MIRVGHQEKQQDNLLLSSQDLHTGNVVAALAEVGGGAGMEGPLPLLMKADGPAESEVDGRGW